MAELTDDRVEGLFADLRAAHLHRVRPPGAAEAYTTVRRRRRNASVSVGIAIVVGLAGTTSAWLAVQERHTRMAGEVALAKRADEAEAALGPRQSGYVIPSMGGGAPLRGTGFTQAKLVMAGEYVLTVACAGAGEIRVVIRTDAHEQRSFIDGTAPVLATRTVGCDARPIVVAMNVIVPVTGDLGVEVQPDAEAQNRAGFAYRAELAPEPLRRLSRAATAAVTAAPRESGDIVDGGLIDGTTNPETSGGGTYRISFACIGVGSLRPVLVRSAESTNGKEPLDFDISCRSEPMVEQYTFTTDDTIKQIALVPVDNATNPAVVAFRLVRTTQD